MFECTWIVLNIHHSKPHVVLENILGSSNNPNARWKNVAPKKIMNLVIIDILMNFFQNSRTLKLCYMNLGSLYMWCALEHWFKNYTNAYLAFHCEFWIHNFQKNQCTKKWYHLKCLSKRPWIPIWPHNNLWTWHYYKCVFLCWFFMIEILVKIDRGQNYLIN